MRKSLLPLLMLLISSSALANPFGQLTALVPINPGTVAGAGGAQWTTTLWASNTSDQDVRIPCWSIRVPPFDVCPVLKAHSTTSVGVVQENLTHQGFFIGVPSTFIPTPTPRDAVSFSLRVSDSISDPTSAGTEIPLPKPSDFRNATIALAQVPVNSHSRSRLRIYGLTNGTAIVRVIGVQSNQELLKSTVTLTGVDANPNPLLRYPSFGEIAFPDVYAGTDTAVRIEITPSEALSVWGFVSVTDTVSHQFTVVSPSSLEYQPISLL